MSSRTALLGTVLSVVLVVASVTVTARQTASNVQITSGESGRSLYDTYCATCHGNRGKGDGPVGAALKPRPADLTQIAKRNDGVFPADRIATIIDGRERSKPHGTQMPAWWDAFSRTSEGNDKDTVERRIQALVKYLESLQEH